MSTLVDQIMVAQERIVERMKEIRSMERGTLSYQKYPERAQRRGGRGAVGPYGLWQGTVKGKRFGKRVSGQEAEQIEAAIKRRHVFESLCDEYKELCCRLSEVERAGKVNADQLKKGLKSRSKRTRKSPES